MENMRRMFTKSKVKIELSDISNVNIPPLSSRYNKAKHVPSNSYGRPPARSVSQLFCFKQRVDDSSGDKSYNPYSLPKDVADAWIKMAPENSQFDMSPFHENDKSCLREKARKARTTSVLDLSFSGTSSVTLDMIQTGFEEVGATKASCRGFTSMYNTQLQKERFRSNRDHKQDQRFKLHRLRMSSTKQHASGWQSAVDAKTGRTYYHNTITGITQWRMPMELASESERVIMEAQEKKQKEFFACMEANILRNFASGTIGTPRQGELKRDTSAKKEISTRPNMVRTISTMDEDVLKEIVQTRKSQKPRRGSLVLSSLLKEDPRDTALDSLQESIREDFSFDTSSPALQFSYGQAFMACDEGSFFGEESSSDGFGLSIAEVNALQEIAKASEQMSNWNDSTFGASSAVFDFDPAEAEQGEEDFRASLSKPARPLGSIAPIKEEEEESTSPTVVVPKPRSFGVIKPLVRRNTCGTLYVKSTMSQPDKDATIKCVCGVYRAHIAASAMEENLNGGYDPMRDPYRIFNDRESQRENTEKMKDSLSLDSLKLNESEREVPHLDEITLFYRDVFRRAQMESDCIIMSLIYVERLIKDSYGQLRPRKSNWRSLLFASMVLSSKVWDDLSMWNADFSQACPAGIAFTLKRINELELKVLNALKYNVKVPASEYAKYYFLLRSMLIKSGLGGEDVISEMPLDIEGAKKLQQVTSRFQSSANKRVEAANVLRSKSMDEADRQLLMAAAQRHAKGAQLEHMVQM